MTDGRNADGLLNQRMSDNSELYWTGHLLGSVLHYDSSLYSRKNSLGIKMIRNLFSQCVAVQTGTIPHIPATLGDISPRGGKTQEVRTEKGPKRGKKSEEIGEIYFERQTVSSS